MIQPQGFEDPSRPHQVCKLHKSLYGLKQALRAWFEKLQTALLNLRFTSMKSDHSLFTQHTPHSTTFVLVYVDDILITGSNKEFVESLIVKLSSCFALKDLGALNYFLGVQVLETENGLFLSQRKYILDLLNKAKMQYAKGCSTPMTT